MNALRPNPYLNPGGGGNSKQQQPHQSTAATQFQQWTEERDAFVREAEDADKTRKELEDDLKSTREEQKRIGIEIQTKSSALGGVHREREMLQREVSRLRRVMGEERVALETCAKDAEAAANRDRKRKEEYLKAATELEDELCDLLLKREDARLRSMISVSTVPILIEYYKGVGPNADSPLPGEEGSKLVAELEEAAGLLTEKTDAYRAVRTRRDSLRATLRDCRSRATGIPLSGAGGPDAQVSPYGNYRTYEQQQTRFDSTFYAFFFRNQHTQCLSLAQLKELEANWSVQDDPEDACGDGKNTTSGPPPVHVQLFYGAETGSSGAVTEEDGPAAGDETLAVHPHDESTTMEIEEEEDAATTGP